MEIAYYYDPAEKECPVDAFLEEKVRKCSDLSEGRKARIAFDLQKKFEEVLKRQGHPFSGIAEPVKKYSFFKINQKKDENKLIRVFYCCHGDLMVLLYAFEKPRKYDGKKKEKRAESKHYQKAQECYLKFKSDPDRYIIK